ncbi:LysR family transcriptional regulator [Pseudomonas sp. NPDC089554]|uniref:LysR family transcriptional regulator n=1 Tax=Pseudomonas sp. NPDC089554 TaxID=3390653 RepID=UPI003D01F0C3
MQFDGSLMAELTILAAVAESRGFTRAANALGLSASGVSKAVSRLEKRMAVRLVERTTRSLVITDEGTRLLQTVVPLMTGIAEAAALASGGVQAVNGRLRVNVDPFFSRVMISAMLPVFMDNYPDVQLELIMRDDLGDLVADGFDLAIRFGAPPTGSFVGRCLFETKVLTVASPEYIRLHGHPKSPADVETHRKILFYNAASGRPFEWEFHRKKRVVKVGATGPLLVSDVGTMLTACAEGGGIAQILELGSEQLIASGKLINLFPEWNEERFPLYAIYPSRRHLPGKVRAFIEFCAASLASRATQF